MAGVAEHASLAFVGIAPAKTRDIRLTQQVDAMTAGVRLFDGETNSARGSYEDERGAHFFPNGDAFHAHPPWRGALGEVYAEFALDLPVDAETFMTDVAMEFGGLEGKTDGVTYQVRAEHGEQSTEAEAHHASEEPATLSLDLRPFAGGPVRLRLSAGPGPDRNVSYDWARWRSPRITRAVPDHVRIGVGGVRGRAWALAGCRSWRIPENEAALETAVSVPGRLYLVDTLPAPPGPAIALAAMPFTATFVRGGTVLETARYACATVTEMRCGGVSRHGIFAHPPSNGRTQVDFLVHVPESGGHFAGWAGLRDGANSAGVLFRVEMNGRPVVEQETAATAWHALFADLSPWAGGPAVLSLVTDSMGDDQCDWACWGDPVLQ